MAAIPALGLTIFISALCSVVAHLMGLHPALVLWVFALLLVSA